MRETFGEFCYARALFVLKLKRFSTGFPARDAFRHGRGSGGGEPRRDRQGDRYLISYVHAVLARRRSSRPQAYIRVQIAALRVKKKVQAGIF